MREKLDDVLVKIQNCRIDLEVMKAEQKLCHDTFGVAMKLRDHPQFWPYRFDVQTFVKVEGDLLSLDATVTIAGQRLASATSQASDIAGYIRISEMYSKMGHQPPPDKNGQTLDQALDDAHGEAMLALEEIPLLLAQLQSIIGDMRSLLG